MKMLKYRHLSLYLQLMFKETDITKRVAGFNKVFNLLSV